jgi:hypothetical protein
MRLYSGARISSSGMLWHMWLSLCPALCHSMGLTTNNKFTLLFFLPISLPNLVWVCSGVHIPRRGMLGHMWPLLCPALCHLMGLTKIEISPHHFALPFCLEILPTLVGIYLGVRIPKCRELEPLWPSLCPADCQLMGVNPKYKMFLKPSSLS